MKSDTVFTFTGYDDYLARGRVDFHYSLEALGKLHTFTEKLEFVPPRGWTYDNNARAHITPILQSLLLVLGISYWKLYCPRSIRIESFTLDAGQAEFWNLLYTKGLGEFFYKNSIDFRNLVRFPVGETAPMSINRLRREQSGKSLVMLGGGKDSIVTIQLLQDAKKDFSLVTINPNRIHSDVAALSSVPLISLKRRLDPKILGTPRYHGAYGGHIPISSVYAFTDILIAQVFGFDYVITSNEHSSNYGNVLYHDMEINHQWSKSWEFERAFRAYVKDYVTPDVEYFSLLRPLTEVHITKLFCRYSRYFQVFSSCNRNFSTTIRAPSRWCGMCPKCAFVFLLLSAYLDSATLHRIFEKNLFDDLSLVPVYKELLGCTGIKPFECVGTPEESLYAALLARQNPQYTKSPVMKSIAPCIASKHVSLTDVEKRLFSVGKVHAIPKSFQNILTSV